MNDENNDEQKHAVNDNTDFIKKTTYTWDYIHDHHVDTEDCINAHYNTNDNIYEHVETEDETSECKKAVNDICPILL